MEGESVEEKTLTEDIAEFNRRLDLMVEKLEAWKTDLITIQGEFVKKLQKKVVGMKV